MRSACCGWWGFSSLAYPGLRSGHCSVLVFQFVPQIGAVLGVVGPALIAMFKWGDWEHPIYVLILYAVIAVVDGFVLQPYIMKRTAKVPVWASILAPIVLGIVIPFWGVLLAPPLLAVLYAYKAREARAAPMTSFADSFASFATFAVKGFALSCGDQNL